MAESFIANSLKTELLVHDAALLIERQRARSAIFEYLWKGFTTDAGGCIRRL